MRERERERERESAHLAVLILLPAIQAVSSDEAQGVVEDVP